MIIYASDTAEPMDTPKIAPAEPMGSDIGSPGRKECSTSSAITRPETTLKKTSSTSSTVVGSMLPLPWQ